MMFTKILGNIKDISCENLECETISISSDQLEKKIMRVISDLNNEYGIDLKQSPIALTDGVVLYQDEKKIIVLRVQEDKCIVIKPKNIDQMGEIAHYLGNMHMPVEIKDNCILLHFDPFLQEALTEKNVPFSVEQKKLDRALKHVEFGHKH